MLLDFEYVLLSLCCWILKREQEDKLAMAAKRTTMKMRAVRVSQRRCVRGVVGLKRSTTVEKKEKMGRNARGKRVVVKALAEAQKQEEDIDVDLVCLGLVGWWWGDERKKKTMMIHEMCAAPSLSVSD